ncbi:hypothetical protein FQR65_LT05755 [Abscondita terminalis]|nr:hypothetical protein FQR65_LT05755 [Abscondita terminalis]
MCQVNTSRLPQYVAALIASLATVSSGTTIGWTGNTIDLLLAGEYNDIPISLTNLGWLTSLPSLASIISAFPIGMMCDKYGRKTTLIISTIITLLGWVIILFANSIEMLLIGRFVDGLGSGSNFFLVPIYICEIAEKEIRGKLSSFIPLFFGIGVFLSYVLGYVATLTTLTVVCTAIPGVFLIGILFQTESPVYIAKQKRYDEAKKILTYLRGKSNDVQAEINEIMSGLELENNESFLKNFLKKRSAKIATIVTFFLFFLQVACGTIAIVFYTSYIFETSGAALNNKLTTIVFGAIQLIAAFTSSHVIEVFRRRVLLLTSCIFSAIGLLTIGTFLSLKDRGLVSDEILSSISFMPILGLCVFSLAVSVGIMPIPSILAAELYPPEIKGVGVSAAGIFNSFLVFLISRFYPNLKVAVGGDVTFYIFTAVCWLGVVFTFLVVPETKGKPLEQIQYELNK